MLRHAVLLLFMSISGLVLIAGQVLAARCHVPQRGWKRIATMVAPRPSYTWSPLGWDTIIPLWGSPTNGWKARWKMEPVSSVRWN